MGLPIADLDPDVVISREEYFHILSFWKRALGTAASAMLLATPRRGQETPCWMFNIDPLGVPDRQLRLAELRETLPSANGRPRPPPWGQVYRNRTCRRSIPPEMLSCGTSYY